VTDAELALLSLLTDTPKSDDMLFALIEARGLRRWTAIGVASMYYVLNKLEQQGLVHSVRSADSERQWTITNAGFAVLQTSVSDLLSTPRGNLRNFELGLANLQVLKTSQVRGALLNYQQELGVRIRKAQREQVKEQDGSTSFQTNALYSHTIAMLEAELNWLETFIAEWEAQAVETPSEPFPTPNVIPRSQQVVLPQDEDSIHKGTTIQANFRKPTLRLPRPE